MDALEKLEREVEFWKRYNSQLSEMLSGLQKEKAKTVRILQQKQAELARLKQVRMTKARRVTAT
ncbi:hypothetical protein [Thermococcus sp. Bubb.Bath]|uniref:hypothetical protein n=1 Tax=Thermococcus sp. Bubb.Bath TaxID=1638242 RepID=UPI00143AC02A|nr:hypothetical protein [Thermococcus sp. Bubb.Bath]NJF24551.1 hypothetical protein [Thermococcus sp. Bubb.Bath]